MKKKVESNIAEIILTIITIIVLTSCGSTYSTCPSYGNNNVKTTINV
jgi:hypothetical protein